MSKKKDSLKPWLSRPAINRSVTLPLTRPLTQRLSNLNEFHPNELDPYLLFDARDSMIGTLENPTLDLDASKPDSLNVITATRAGVATYTDPDGLIASAPANTVRVDHVDGVPMILVEPSATNLVTHTDFSTGWTLSSSNKQETDISSPFASQNALRVTASETYGRIQDYIGSSSVTTISVYVKRDATDSRVSINSDGYGSVHFNLSQAGASYHSVDGSPAGYDIEEHGDGWWRISASFSSVDYFKLYPDTELGTRSVLFALPQVETGSVATSYIPALSGSTVTRAADQLVISGSDFTDFFNGSEGTFFIQAQNRTPELDGAVLMGQNSNRMFFYKSNPNRLSTYDGGSFTHHDGLVANQLFNAAVTFNTSNRSSSLDGSALDTNTINTQWAGADILKIGLGYSNIFHGHFRRILFWPYHSDSL